MPAVVSQMYAGTPVKASAFSGNPLDDVRYKGQPDAPVDVALDPTIEQSQYKSYLEQRLTRAQQLRDRRWPEFSNKTYLEQFQQNEKIANTYLEPKRNEEDVQVASGTVENKLTVVLANIDALNLMCEVLAYDKNDVPLSMLAQAITDIFDRTSEHDGGTAGGDSEKRSLRQRELCKQGTAFVQERWAKKFYTRKKLSKKYNGEFNGVAWSSKLDKVFEGPERQLLYAPSVYLGDITQFSMDDQPYVFTVEQVHYDMAKSIYGSFDNWKYVKPGMPPSPATLAANAVGGRTIYDGKFRLTTLKDDQVEIVKYQDQTRDEFMIEINGVMMLPPGFPLSAVVPGGRYNITKQILYPINPQFAYGKGFVASGDIYELSRLIDEMLRLFVMKTRKSITPAYINTSGRVISKRVLQPGNISQGIPVNSLVPVATNETQGVTSAEFQIYEELVARIDASTVSPIFQGQIGAHMTATEVLQLQQSAKLSLGIIVAACTSLEIKLGYLRLPNILANWFIPTGEVDVAGVFQKTYRNTTKNTAIANVGNGTRRVIPVTGQGQLPPPAIVRALELQDEDKTGVPSQRIYLSVNDLRAAEITWRIVANPKPVESTAADQVAFGSMLTSVVSLMNVGAKPNVQGLETQFAKVYGIDRSMAFANSTDQVMGPGAAAGAAMAGQTSGSPSTGQQKGVPPQGGPQPLAAPSKANAAGVPSLSGGMKSAGSVIK